MKFGKLRSHSRTKNVPRTLDLGARTNPDPALKGKKGGNCNRTACQMPEAYYFNTGTNSYYCWTCAHDIDSYNRRVDGDEFVLFPDINLIRAAHDAFLKGEAESVELALAEMKAGETRLSDDDHYKPCCENEQRGWGGGCRNCGDPCF